MKLPLLPLLASLGLATSANSLAKVHYVDRKSSNPVPPYSDWSTAATNIQDAIDVALDGDQVLVRRGLYASGGRAVSGTTTNRAAIDRAISVVSANGPAVTVIEGAPADGGAIRCAYVGANAVLSGFMLTNGWTSESGGGVWCDPGGIVTNCVITGNAASMEGGGAWFGTLYNCVLTGNRAEGQGGGVYSATLYNCTLTGNSAGYEGGGACFSDLYNCTLTGNAADEGGGTAAGRLYNCIT
jgi:parallel beta-helix repeat protein